MDRPEDRPREPVELVELVELVRSLRAGRDGALVALDFDGTLAPIVTDPAAARPVPGAGDALRALADRGVRLAVITGRDAATVLRLGDLEAIAGLVVAGLYGAETWTAGRLTSPPTPPAMAALPERLPELLRAHGADPAIWIEDKRLSLVVHARRATDPAAALAGLRGPLATLAAELGLELHPGRDVLELRLPEFDKATALRSLVSDYSPRTLLFAGDDVGDLPAMDEIRRLRATGLAAWAVGVHNDEAPEVAASADLTVADPAALVRLLAAIAE